ncbi:tyrosine-type recombinase/integrase [Nocardia abscessus]|uniref:tyrosine-type recombinase/integrase n=1 Tax=Nocardia abscessus TaxID=120957 RepID=UPI00245901E3|nr:tyrosine-type recombinase/integrase [Nocardia abscessus]
MTSTLRTALTDYLSLRRSMGFTLVRAGQLLSSYVAWLDQNGIDVITVDNAMAWVRSSPVTVAGSPGLSGRMNAVRGFADYLHAIDPVHEQIPPGLVSCHRQRAVPYLYSDNDIAAIMANARHIKTPFRRATIATLIGLLAVTGMRIGEVLALDDTDFDPAEALLTVRHAKLGKQRLLPLHPSTVTSVHRYRRRRDREFPHPVSSALLVSGAGTPLSVNRVEKTFAKLVDTAGLRSRSNRRRPRPHDLRHTFAVHTLLDWYRDGGDIDARMPLLSTYLGHVAPANTYWYLTGAPELLAEAARRLDTYATERGERS